MSEKIKGKINKKIIISILVPILIVVLIAGSFFAIIDGMVNIVESFIAKVTNITSDLSDTSEAERDAFWGKLSNIIDGAISGGNDVFDPSALAEESILVPTIIMKQDDFNNIKNSIDLAKVNRETAGLEDYMLKIMLLSYYRSVYLSDFEILMEITDDEKAAIDKMNDEAVAEPDKKYPCPFSVELKDGKHYLKTKGMIIIEVVYEDLDTGIIEEKQLKYYDKEVIENLFQTYKIYRSTNSKYAYSIKNFLKTVYTTSSSDHGEILVPTIDDSKKTIVYNYDDPRIEDYMIEEITEEDMEFTIINYDIVSAKYGTPVEFLMDLLEITGSRDFLNAFIAVACDEKYYIKIGLYDLTTRTTNITQEEYTEDISIIGTVDTTFNYSIKYIVSGYPTATTCQLGIHYGTLPADDGDTYIYIIDPDASGRTYYLYKEDSSRIMAQPISIDTNEDGTDESKMGWKISTTGGIRDAFKRKYDANVTATTTEIINESSYDTSIKEVYCWWAYIEKQCTETEVVDYTNITEDGKNYVETNNMHKYVSNDLIEGLFDDSNNYIINTITGSRKSPELIRKIDSPTVFIQNPTVPITGIEGLYNQLFNKILIDSSIDYSHGSDEEDAAVQAEISNNGITADKFEWAQLSLAYDDDLQIEEVSIIRTAHTSGGPATGDFKIEEVLALLKDASGNVVEYGDLYRSDTGAGEMLENGAEMLFQLLDSSENTEGLADVMRYILYCYNGIDYGVTAFDAGILGDLDFSGIGSVIIGNTVEDKLWYTLKAAGYSEYSIAAVMGNIDAESGFKTNNLENGFEAKLGYTDESYTEAVNNGSYSEVEFISDHDISGCGAGYGLCQWTFGTRKQGLYKFAKEDKGVGIDDVDMQIEFLLGELSKTGGANGKATCQIDGSNNGYKYEDWYNAESIEKATKAFMCIFERPAVMDEAEGNKRTTRAEYYYNMYHGKTLSGGTEEAVGSGAIVTRFTSSITGRTFTVWNQTKLETYWIDKCNLCAAACLGSGYRSVVETETGVLNNAKNVGGYLLSNDALNKSFFDDYGLKAKIEGKSSYSKENIRTLLTSGKYICIRFNMSGTGKAAIGKSGAQYTNIDGGHWVAIIGYDYNDGNERIYVSDSGHGETGWKDIDEFDPLKSYMSYFTIISEKQ